MSRLESFIRRMQAQVHCLDTAVRIVSGVPGVIWEMGLGNGRSFDHLCERFPDREIYAFDRAVNAHPDCVPEAGRMILGELADTLPAAVRRFAGRVALVHCDIGSGDAEENRRIARFIGERIGPALSDGALVIADRDLGAAWLMPVPLPDAVWPGRYYMYRHMIGAGSRPQPSPAA